MLGLMRDTITQAALGRRERRDPKPHVTLARPRRRATEAERASGLRWARALDLGPCLRLGRGETQHGGRDKDSVLASAFEAMVGALYVAGGLAAALRLVERLLDDAPASPVPGRTP